MSGEEDDDKRERLAAIGEIASEVAHELRNALQIISANVYLARLDLPRCEPNLAKIERSARLAHAIVDDLMALARGEPAHAEPVLFVEVLVAAREDLGERAAVYEDHLLATLRVRAHHGLLSRCLHVLYENAIAASAPRAPIIATRAWAADGRFIFEVTDDGPGVPPDIASTLFEPLVSARPGGTGLGLALARRIVAAHAGTIALAPASPARAGATFRVELPSK
jgi:signal transduction histidine kinase